MDGRFPFNAPGAGGNRQQPQFNSAQVRAALGLPPIDEASLYLQQAQRQQQQHQQQHHHHEHHNLDMQLRQRLLQEQLDQQLVEQRLRSVLEQQQHSGAAQTARQQLAAAQQHGGDFSRGAMEEQYQRLVLQQHLQQAAAQQAQQRRSDEEEYLRQHASAVAAAQLRFRQDEARRLAMGLPPSNHPEELAHAAHPGPSVAARREPTTIGSPQGPYSHDPAMGPSAAALAAAAAREKTNQMNQRMAEEALAKAQQQQIEQQEAQEAAAKEAAKKKREEDLKAAARAAALAPTKKDKNKSKSSKAKRDAEEAKDKRRGSKAKDAKSNKAQKVSKKSSPKNKSGKPPAASSKATSGKGSAAAAAKPYAAKSSASKSAAKGPKTTKVSGKSAKAAGNNALDAVAIAAGMSPTAPPHPRKQHPPISSQDAAQCASFHPRYSYSYPPPEEPLEEEEEDEPVIMRKGTLEEILSAADEQDKTDDAADTLRSFLNVEWPESEGEDDQNENENDGEIRLVESIVTPTFKSFLPLLPVEPELIITVSEGSADEESDEEMEDALTPQSLKRSALLMDESEAPSSKKPAPKKKLPPSVPEYPFPVDTWWPSTSGMRRERRQAGETSDEDNFEEDEPAVEEEDEQHASSPRFRANEPKICQRLSSSVEPGVLEKLNHCKIHRIRSKKKKVSTTNPELVYCFQVTELYPNDVMVNCSVCGTWRHAACGGHYEQYSSREVAKSPFVAVCENCHEERKLLEDNPKGEQRLERQRNEQLRRGLATTAVMRNASYSKHSGTYKWPLGSVSATHIGGHTRSVHARHDKAERQWTDMASRLGRGFGYRPKDRVRIRTKELERLLVSIEDSESYTDRHNMLLFLLRDTARDVPIGYEGQPQNIFDPASDTVNTAVPTENVEDAESSIDTNGGTASADVASVPSFAQQLERRPQSLDNTADGSSSSNSNGASPSATIKCARHGCQRCHRIDSLFCSDGCGVLALEMDLLRSLQDASDVHPSVLRLN